MECQQKPLQIWDLTLSKIQNLQILQRFLWSHHLNKMDTHWHGSAPHGSKSHPCCRLPHHVKTLPPSPSNVLITLVITDHQDHRLIPHTPLQCILHMAATLTYASTHYMKLLLKLPMTSCFFGTNAELPAEALKVLHGLDSTCLSELIWCARDRWNTTVCSVQGHASPAWEQGADSSTARWVTLSSFFTWLRLPAMKYLVKCYLCKESSLGHPAIIATPTPHPHKITFRCLHSIPHWQKHFVYMSTY